MSLSLTRRRFLQLGACSTVAISITGCRRDKPEPHKLVFLSEAEYAATASACERLLPRDADPGAIDLGVPDYIDQALATDQARVAEKFRSGLHALDGEARHRAGTQFADTSATAQDNILDDWQEGTPEQAEFVRILMNLTLEGAFGDPSHGGNRGGRGWGLIGFEPCEPRHHG